MLPGPPGTQPLRLAYGESPHSYLMTRRVERAMALLRRGGLSVTEVCFASPDTFTTRFTELVGMPPCIAKQVTGPVRNREARVRRTHLV